MIGNDVVDFEAARRESNIWRKGYFQKVLTDSEIATVLSAEQPELIFWTIWSIKESAYKIANRKTGIRKYNPKSFECSYNPNNQTSIVRFEEFRYHGKSSFTNNLIASRCAEDFESLRKIKDGNCMKIKTVNYIPFVEIKDKNYIASVSHHGRFREVIYLLDSQL